MLDSTPDIYRKESTMRKFLNILEKTCSWIVIGLAVALIFDVMLQIFTRFILVRPVSWTEELSRFLLAGIVAFGTPVCARKNLYIRVDVLLIKFSSKIQIFWIGILDLIVTVFLIIVAYKAVSYVKIGAMQSSPVLHIPMSVIFSSVLIGPALTAIFFFERAWDIFVTSWKKGAM